MHKIRIVAVPRSPSTPLFGRTLYHAFKKLPSGFGPAELVDDVIQHRVYSRSYCRASIESDHERQKNIQVLCSHGDLDGALGVLSSLLFPVSKEIYLSLLKSCNVSKSLDHLTIINAHIAQHNVDLHGILGDYLVLSFAKCGAISDAYQLCRRQSFRTVFSWTAIVSAYADCCCGNEALQMFREMQEGSVAPNSYTFVSLLKACGNIADLNQGKKLHALAHIEGFTSLLHVGNTLISMYGKCGVVEEAVCVFSRMREWDIVSWNAMLSAYIDGDQGEKALLLYRQMQEEMVDPNMRTLVLALQACTAFVEERGPSAQLMVLEVGRAFHSLSRCRGYSSDVVMGTALLHMYGSCGSFMEAEDIFNALPNHDVVSWTALVSAYVSQGQGKKALFAYRQMHVEGVSPNDLTFSVVLQALRHVNNSQDLALERESVDWALEVGRALYSDIYNRGLTSNHTVGNPLISMFGQFHAGIPEAEAIFDALIERNIVSWNALLSSYVEHSEVENFLQLFLWLKRENLAFTDLTFIAVLQGCSELGNLELCRQVHFDIYSSEFDRYHSVIATLINAYGSSGSMTDAQAVFNELVEPHTVSCNACVAGHARDGHQEASLHFIDEMILESNVLDEATLTSILSACSHSGVVDKGFDYLHLVCTHYAMVPAVKHYGIMIDLLGRAGDFKHAERLLEMIPMPPDATLWLSLLSSCRFHGNLMLAKQAFISLLHVQPKHGAAYVLFSNLCAEIELEVFLDEADWNCGKVNHL